MAAEGTAVPWLSLPDGEAAHRPFVAQDHSWPRVKWLRVLQPPDRGLLLRQADHQRHVLSLLDFERYQGFILVHNEYRGCWEKGKLLCKAWLGVSDSFMRAGRVR